MKNSAQVIEDGFGKTRRILRLPAPEKEVLPGIRWGRAEVLFTPAFWKATMWLAETLEPSWKRFGNGCDLRTELTGCLLGGYGITFELNKAAFCAVQASGLLSEVGVDERDIETILSQPLQIGPNKTSRYRFPRQKARFLAAALNKLSDSPPCNLTHKELRDWLTTFSGIGLKTASWIVRNFCGSDGVAIIDVHILRAGQIMGLFSEHQTPTRDYLSMEARFVEFATRIDVPTSQLDLVMWEQMRMANRIGFQALRRRSENNFVV